MTSSPQRGKLNDENKKNTSKRHYIGMRLSHVEVSI